MNSESLESDSSSFRSVQAQKPSFALFFSEISKQNSQEEIKEIVSNFMPLLYKSEGENFMQGLKLVEKIMEKGYCEVLISDELAKKLMKQFSKFSYEIENNPKAEIRMIFVLSIIAEMIKQVPKYKFPFGLKFLKNIFLIDQQLLQLSPYKNNIMAILAVIYENLSSQSNLMKALKVNEKVKQAILEKYSLVEEIFSIRFLNKAIYNLLKQKQTFTACQIHKYGLINTVSRFISETQKKIFLNSLQFMMVQKKRKIKIVQPTLIIKPNKQIMTE